MKLNIKGAGLLAARKESNRNHTMGNWGNAKNKHEEEGAGDCRTPALRVAGDTRRRRQASGSPSCLCCCQGLGKLLRRERRSREPFEQSDTVEAHEQGHHAPHKQGAAERSCALQSKSRAVLQISAVHVVKAEHGRAPTMLTAAYKGWWQTPKVHLLLTLERVAKAAPQRHQQQQQPGAGKERLLQWFPPGRGPTLRVKGRARTLVLRLYTGERLTARAEVPLGELLSRTAEGVACVPLEVKAGGALQQAWVEVAQVSPRPTPLPPPRCPLRLFSQDTPPHQFVFPPPRDPTPFRLKQMVRDMCGAPLDNTDWSKPFQLSRETSPAGDASTTTIPGTTSTTSSTTSTDGPETAPRDVSRTDGCSARGGAAPARRSTQYQLLFPGQPVPRSVPPPGRCRRALRFVLICLWVLAAYKIVTDLTVAVQETVHWAFFDTMQDTERGLAWTPAPLATAHSF